MGDGFCDDGWLSVNLDCAYFEYDDGDCGSGTGTPGDCDYGDVADCDGVCFGEWSIGDGYCDDGSAGWGNFNCVDFDYDGGDCDGGDSGTEFGEECETEEWGVTITGVIACDGECSTLTDWIGDGVCDSRFDCAETGWDGGDCEGGDTGTSDPPTGTCDGEDLGSATGVAVAAGDSTDATHDWEPDCVSLSYHETPDVEFWWSPPVTGPYSITTYGSDFDTVLSIIEEDCSTVMACNDEAASGDIDETSALEEYMYSGVDYLIVIDGYSFSDYGSYVLNIAPGL
jgi:hypothetical protein